MPVVAPPPCPKNEPEQATQHHNIEDLAIIDLASHGKHTFNARSKQAVKLTDPFGIIILTHYGDTREQNTHTAINFSATQPGKGKLGAEYQFISALLELQPDEVTILYKNSHIYNEMMKILKAHPAHLGGTIASDGGKIPEGGNYFVLPDGSVRDETLQVFYPSKNTSAPSNHVMDGKLIQAIVTSTQPNVNSHIAHR